MEQLSNKSSAALLRAIQLAGSQSALGRRLGRPQALIHKWLHSKKPVGADHCAAIERVTAGAVTRRDLRPDDWHLIWPELTPTPKEGAAHA